MYLRGETESLLGAARRGNVVVVGRTCAVRFGRAPAGIGGSDDTTTRHHRWIHCSQEKMESLIRATRTVVIYAGCRWCCDWHIVFVQVMLARVCVFCG
ncbi:hypothetical protein BS78_09G258600 [Paspalum vaginatum]|nr:hypothetical protein BS78_09G258600 [Paspalum vaginatum]